MRDEPAARWGSGTMPTGHQLRSALRAGQVIAEVGSPLEDARASYAIVPYGGIYRSDDLVIGEQLLIVAGLLEQRDDILMPRPGLREIASAGDTDGCEALLIAFLSSRPPLWLSAATAGGVVVDELIPDDAQRALEEIMTPQMREVLLLQLGRRFSDVERMVTADLTEDFIVERCQTELRAGGAPQLATNVRRLSLLSDQLGYDITAPRLDGTTRRIEAKGFRGDGVTIVIYLSRNEANRAMADADWFLVACRVAAHDCVELVGYLTGSDLAGYLPSDPCPATRWQSIRLELPAEMFAPGLPR